MILASSSVVARKQRRSCGTLARSPMLHSDQDRSACGRLEKNIKKKEMYRVATRTLVLVGAKRDRSPVYPKSCVRTISRLPSAAENYSNLRMEGLTRLQEHRLELQHRLDMHRTQMEMPPSPSPSSRSLAPFSSASSSLSEGSNQPSGEDSASIVTGTLFFSHSSPSPQSIHCVRPTMVRGPEPRSLLLDDPTNELRKHEHRIVTRIPRESQLPKIRRKQTVVSFAEHKSRVK